MSKKKAWAGWDPGKSGAIVFLIEGEQNPIFFKCPLIGDYIDILSLDQYLREVISQYDVHFVLEQVHSIFGASAGSNFNFGFNCGIAETLLVSNRISFTKVQPKEWQKICFQGIPEMREPGKSVKDKKGIIKIKPGKLKTKEMSIMAIKRLYPNFSLLPTQRSKKEDSNIADAANMMHYCKTYLYKNI